MCYKAKFIVLEKWYTVVTFAVQAPSTSELSSCTV